MKLVEYHSGQLELPGFRFEKLGLVVIGEPSEQEWLAAGDFLDQAEGAIHWWIGDWLNYGEHRWGESHQEMMERTGFSYDTVRHDKWVASVIKVWRRRHTLSWSHHREVVGLQPEGQDYWLDRAEEEKWSCAELRRQMRFAEMREMPALPEGKYRCLVIDPPWPMERIPRRTLREDTRLSYPRMELEAIAELEIPTIADPEGCHIYLWVTQRFLPDGLDLFDVWGVQYQCLLTWVKPTGFTPFSWMYNAEHVLFGRIGSLPLMEFGIRLAFEAAPREHSRKPGEFYDMVRRVSPSPRLDMFSRESREGFDAWGDETGRFDSENLRKAKALG